MSTSRAKSTAAADDSARASTPELVEVVYTRQHFPSGSAHPKEPGHREQLPLDQARALRSYQIVSIENDPDARSVQMPPPALERAPDRESRSSDFHYNAGGLLIVPDAKLVR